nr:EOG090X03TW [Cyclestheria hislopi]
MESEITSDRLNASVSHDCHDSPRCANDDGQNIGDQSSPYNRGTSEELNGIDVSKELKCKETPFNGDVGFEIAVEAHPDLVFESDLVTFNSQQFPFVPPRVYLERESFSNEDLQNLSIQSPSESDTFFSTEEEEEEANTEAWKSQPKHIFILSEAGKPIYTKYGNEEQFVTLFGVMQALVSVFEDGKDTLDTIVAGDSKFVFLHQRPLILVAVSKLKDSVEQLRTHLRYMYNQIVSVITAVQLERIFEQRQNYDLRRLIAGSERLMDSLVKYMNEDFSVLLGGIRCLPMLPQDREAVTQTIVHQCIKIKNLLFALLIGNSQIISMATIKKQHLHPSDIHLIINLVNCSETFKTAEGWTPICLPHYDPSTFLYVHASYLSDDCQACLLFFTSDRESFFSLSEAKRRVVERLRRHNLLESINSALNYVVPVLNQIGVADIRHLLYKYKAISQFTSCSFYPPYHHEQGRAYLMDLYRHIHGRMHLPARNLKLICHTTDKEILFGWETTTYELYVIFEPMATKRAVVNSALTILKWIKREEDAFFIVNPATW